MKKYQTGEEPTIEEMRDFAAKFEETEWAKLIQNPVFVSNYDKDLDTVSKAADLILAGKRVTNIKDVVNS